MNYHADIIGQRMILLAQDGAVQSHQQSPVGRDSDGRRIDNKVQDSSIVKTENICPKKEAKLSEETYEGSDDIDDIILEANDLIDNSPWALAMDKYLDKELNIDLDLLLDEALEENPVRKEKENPLVLAFAVNKGQG